MAQHRWHALTTTQRAGLVALASVQVSLAVSAWADLAVRPAAQVTGGKKLVWAAVIAIDVAGPLAYFTKGRRTSAAYPEAGSTP